MEKLHYFFSIFLLFGWCFGCSDAANQVDYHPMTVELISLMKTEPGVQKLLEQSIERAKIANPDPKTNPIQSLEQYLEFVSNTEKGMPWSLYEQKDSIEVYSDISKSLRYFYFLINQPLPELAGKGLYNNTIQFSEPFVSWLTKFNKEWGNTFPQRNLGTTPITNLPKRTVSLG
ncbi:hypothetical protein V8V91_07420 [Algoriphagus halophilus]|uniref:hypothetical protein n=1 Tax=Algoriphagus halophilus TaxID=226505 RepID=UPI00358E6993